MYSCALWEQLLHSQQEHYRCTTISKSHSITSACMYYVCTMYVCILETLDTHTWTRADFVDLKGVYDITWIHTELTHKPFALADLVG